MSQDVQRFEISIRTTEDELWRAITDPALTRQYYFSSDVASAWEVGAPMRYVLPDGSVAIHGEILAIEPPHRLVTTFSARWDDDVAADPAHRVTWEVEAAGEVCKLVVVHEGFTRRTATYEQVASGMPVLLAGLKRLLETGHSPPAAPGPDPSNQSEHDPEDR